MSSELFLSATISSASSCRSILSVRQSFASSIAARSRFPRCSSSFDSNREKSAKASADEPANPASTVPPESRRILAAVFFMMVVPSVTWPSEAIATRSPCRTQMTVVECHFSPGFIRKTRIPRFASRFGVGPAVHLAQVRGVEMRVLLRRRERRVAEELLDRAQVRSGFEKVRREGVAQGVRRDLGGQPRGAEAAFQQPRHRAGGQPSAARVDEERLAVFAFRSRTPLSPSDTLGQIRRERLAGRFAERCDALLVPLSD